MADERVDDGFSGEAFVDEERQHGDVEREALGLTGPVEERSAQPLQVRDRVIQRSHHGQHLPIGRAELPRRGERVRRRQRRGVLGEVEQPLAQLAAPFWPSHDSVGDRDES